MTERHDEDTIDLQLSRDEALVLFEWVQRIEAEGRLDKSSRSRLKWSLYGLCRLA